MKRHRERRQRRGVKRNVEPLGFGLRRLGRDLGLVGAPLPATPIFFGQSLGFIVRDIADHGHHGVLGPVIAIEELQPVVVHLGHVLDIIKETHRRVLVGVRREGLVAHRFVELAQRVGEVLVVFAQYRPRLGAEDFFGIGKVLETVRLKFEDRLEVLFRKHGVIDGSVVGRVGVGRRARGLHDLVPFFRREFLGAAKHHVLEQMREPGTPRLDLIARADLHDDIERDDARVACLDRYQSQPVVEIVDRIGIGKDARLRPRRTAGEDQHKCESGKRISHNLTLRRAAAAGSPRKSRGRPRR